MHEYLEVEIRVFIVCCDNEVHELLDGLLVQILQVTGACQP